MIHKPDSMRMVHLIKSGQYLSRGRKTPDAEAPTGSGKTRATHAQRRMEATALSNAPLMCLARAQSCAASQQGPTSWGGLHRACTHCGTKIPRNTKTKNRLRSVRIPIGVHPAKCPHVFQEMLFRPTRLPLRFGSCQCTGHSGLVRCLFDRQGNPKFSTRAYNGLNVYPSMVFFNDAIGE